eukprot:scaffold20734_cov82-Skeletonema_dohrnii-CCMP3373.AAC.4
MTVLLTLEFFDTPGFHSSLLQYYFRILNTDRISPPRPFHRQAEAHDIIVLSLALSRATAS